MIYNYTDTLVDKWVEWCDEFLSHPLANNFNDVNSILNTTGSDNPTRANEFNNIGLLRFPLTNTNIAFEELRHSREVISALGYLSYQVRSAMHISKNNVKLNYAFSALNAIFFLQQFEDFQEKKYSLNFILQSLLTFYPIPAGFDDRQYLKYLSAAMFCELNFDREQLISKILRGIPPKLRIIELKTNNIRFEIESSADVVESINQKVSLTNIIYQKGCLFLIGNPRDLEMRGLFYQAYKNFNEFLQDAFEIEKSVEGQNVFNSIFVKEHNSNVLQIIKNIFTHYNYRESLSRIMKTIKEGSIEASKILDWSEDQVPLSEKGENIIYYGAPGTGKSHRVEQTIQNLDKHFYERVTFHPEFDNSSFIGGYKPTPIEEGDKRGDVTYEFVPQAFAKIYTRAWKETEDKNYYLVIEEINRGNCAEIFGEIFQLLDRTSKYDVTPSEEFRKYLVKELGSEDHDGIKRGLKLPPNLHIWATMNTSDQSLFPMDSAFKRRWQWEYCPICYDPITEEGETNESFNYEIDIEDGEKYSWTEFISKVNLNFIKKEPTLGADKCVGNYFIKPDKECTISLKPFINKVIFYLWNDVFKDEQNSIFPDKVSYEDFFPIQTKGKEMIKEVFSKIELKPKVRYADRWEDEVSRQVAEDRPNGEE